MKLGTQYIEEALNFYAKGEVHAVNKMTNREQ